MKNYSLLKVRINLEQNVKPGYLQSTFFLRDEKWISPLTESTFHRIKPGVEILLISLSFFATFDESYIGLKNRAFGSCEVEYEAEVHPGC